MLKLSRGLESFAPVTETSDNRHEEIEVTQQSNANNLDSTKRHKAKAEWYVNMKMCLISFDSE